MGFNRSWICRCLLAGILSQISLSTATTTPMPSPCASESACECRRIYSRSFVICSRLQDLTELVASAPAKSLSSGSSLPWVRLVDSRIPELGPKAFGDLRAQGLQINASNLSVIADDAFVGMEELRALALQDNQLVRVPTEPLSRLQHLELLSLAGNRIEEVKQGDLVHLQELKYFSLAENCIERVESGALPPSLVHLALGSNKLGTIGDAFKEKGAFPHLEWLLLANNSLHTIHDELHGLTSLQLLFLSDNELVNIRGAFKGLTKLRILHLKYNRLELIDGTFDKLTDLQEVSLRHNLITRVGKLGNTPALTTLDLSENYIEHIQGDAFKLSTRLTKLNLSDNNLQRIPFHALMPLKHLVVLDLSRNQMQSLDGLQQLHLPALKYLIVSGNELTTLPSNLKDHVPSLVQLDVSYNLLTNLHTDTLTGLNLRSLRLQGNPLRCNLDTLQALDSMEARAIDGKPRCSNAILPASNEIE